MAGHRRSCPDAGLETPSEADLSNAVTKGSPEDVSLLLDYGAGVTMSVVKIAAYRSLECLELLLPLLKETPNEDALKEANLHVAVPQHGELAPGGELEYLDGDRVLLAALTREVRETGVRFPPEALLSLDVAERVSLFYDRTAQHGRADRSRSSSQLPRRDKKASKVSSMGSGRRNAGARGTDA